jgi:hypothetical protein
MPGDERNIWATIGGVLIGSAVALFGVAKAINPETRVWPYWVIASIGIAMCLFAVLPGLRRLWPKQPQARVAEDILRQGRRPTSEEHKARRAAEEKRGRGEKLNRKERAILARTDLGVTKTACHSF